ncbi:hypothetical protein [Pectobacterium aroidearum]|uniref:hypothetical protein n=1 Tax=Pectobacterium aroidearum TaxID=1201031 RepID=UPI0026023F2B|nr:hypothetical protein [Pectobacterium aroidearum]WKA60677.1 hypothetical protein QX495_11655 [Pectobacterium aroidearum]
MLKRKRFQDEQHGCCESQCRVGNASLAVRQENVISEGTAQRHHEPPKSQGSKGDGN